MTDPIASELGYATAGHILGAVAGDRIGVAAAGLAGGILWCEGDGPDRVTRRALRDLLGGAGSLETQSAPLGERGRLVAHPVLDAAGTPRSWLIAWTDECEQIGSIGSAWKRVEQTLPRVAEMLGAECRLAVELSGAVEELSNRYEELNIVYRMERAARGSIPNEALIAELLHGFLTHLKIDVGVLVSQNGAHIISARGSERAIPNGDLVLTELRGRIWRFVAASRDMLILNDANDPRRDFLVPNLPFKVLAIPNTSCGALETGLILIRHLDEPDFMNSDMNLARVFFGQVSMLLENRTLIDEMQDFTRQIASALVEAVEAKDPYTRGHSERVEQISDGLARATGMTEPDVTDLLWGALLHDIGKIGVPDAILMKPSRLTEDEFIFIKTHPTRSYEILRHVERLGPAALDAARYHQERFDGEGYPYGLAGTEIPLSARIVAVADTYDAITSSRSYRPASSHEKAISVIESVAGSQLDPELVQIFLDRIERDQEWLATIRPAPESHPHD